MLKQRRRGYLLLFSHYSYPVVSGQADVLRHTVRPEPNLGFTHPGAAQDMENQLIYQSRGTCDISAKSLSTVPQSSLQNLSFLPFFSSSRPRRLFLSVTVRARGVSISRRCGCGISISV